MTQKRHTEDRYLWLARHRLNETQLTQIARRAMETNTALRNARYASSFRTGEVTLEWIDIAMRSVELGVSASAYVTAFWGRSKDPFLNVMRSRKGASQVKDLLAGQEGLIRQALKLQSRRLLEWRRGGNRGTTELLLDSRGQFEPAFIYCIAAWEGLEELKKAYYNKAANAFIDPVTRKVFAEAFPEVVKEMT